MTVPDGEVDRMIGRPRCGRLAERQTCPSARS